MSAAVSFETVAYAALQAGLRLELCYDGYSRVVEVHTIGILKDGNKAMSVYQVRGGSNSGEPEGWKVFLFDRTLTARQIDEESEAPRTGYVRNASQFRVVLCQV
jgi:hypothetical protein